MLNSISRLGETRPEQEWSNGTEFSGYSDFPEFKANLARYTQNFGMKFRKMTVQFTLLPGISGIFGRMEIAPFQSLGSLKTPEVLPAGGFILQQVTITTPEITRCISMDILASSTTLAKVYIRLKPPAREFLRGLEVTEIGISKRKSRRLKFSMSH